MRGGNGSDRKHLELSLGKVGREVPTVESALHPNPFSKALSVTNRERTILCPIICGVLVVHLSIPTRAANRDVPIKCTLRPGYA